MSEASFCVCADAREERGYQDALRGSLADALITDPPYCLLTRRRKGGDLRDKRLRKIDRDPVLRFENVREYRSFTEAWMGRVAHHLRKDAPWIVWTNLLGREPLLTAARTLGYQHLWGEFVWAKRTKDNPGGEQVLRVYEFALVLSTQPPPVKTPETLPIGWSVVSGYQDGEAVTAGSHPHHKPFAVLEPLVRQYTQVGGVVLDPFAGSGSIPVACRRLQRQVACLELVPEWVEMTNHRLGHPLPAVSG